MGSSEGKSDLWATFPEHLRDAYQRDFKYPGDVLNASFQFLTPDKFADVVYDRVIAVMQMKARYVIAPNAWLLPTINRWASKAVQERIFETMFRRS